MLRKPIAILRATRLTLHIGWGLVTAVLYPWLALSLRRRILQYWSRGLLDILNVKVYAGMDANRHGLIVTNHISWLDIFVLNAVVPMRFVAKSEVRGWPVIGWLCHRAGTLFIARGKARDAARINRDMVELLQQGECLAVFPEGTTTDGSHVGHFHASLLQPAIDAGAPLHPVAIRYQDDLGWRSTAAAYFDDISFGTSMWRILRTPELHVRLIATAPLATADAERRTLAHNAQQQITAALDAADSQNFHAAVTPAQHTESNLLPST